MPCGCFGKKKAASEEPEKVPQSEIKYSPSSDVKVTDGDKYELKEVVSDNRDECVLLSSHPQGSRPPYNNVDSPTSNSHTNTHTPSTLPAVASSASSQASSSVTSSPAASRIVAAYSRSQLAEKRREFFVDLYPVERGGTARYYHQAAPTTLPTIARAKQFGKVRTIRPVSQPSSPSDPPVPDAPSPPGPHLLHHCAESPRDSTKIDAKGSGLSSDEFLLELKSASDEISRRWAMDEVDVPEYTSYALKAGALDDEKLLARGVTSLDAWHSESPNSPPNSPAMSEPSQSSGVPETLITPPSPLFPQEASFSQLDSQSPYSEVVSGAKEDLQNTEEDDFADEFRIQEEHPRSDSPHSEEDDPADEQREEFDLMTKRISELEEDSFDLSDQPTTEGYYYTESTSDYARMSENQPLVDVEEEEEDTEMSTEPSANDSELLRSNTISTEDQELASDQSILTYQGEPIVDLDQEPLIKDDFDKELTVNEFSNSEENVQGRSSSEFVKKEKV